MAIDKQMNVRYKPVEDKKITDNLPRCSDCDIILERAGIYHDCTKVNIPHDEYGASHWSVTQVS